MSTHPPIPELLLLANCLEPAERPLLDLIFDRVDDSMLLEIARCDYGDDVEIHLAALHQIRANNIPRPLQWHPGEVLCLTRWDEWDSLNTTDIAFSTRKHWMRLFACTVLIWVSLEREDDEYNFEHSNHIEGENSTIIQFLDSALYLGDDVLIAAIKFLGWRMQSQIERSIDDGFGSCPCYAVAMLLLCVSLDRCNPEVMNFLISMAYCDHEYVPISEEISNDRCQLSQKWRDTIYRILFDPTVLNDNQLGKAHAWRSNPAIQSLGMELIGDAAN
jgi:hypothetical protein